MLGELTTSQRHRRGQWENALSRVEVTAAARLRPRVLLLTRGEYVHGVRLDPETQILVGAQNGLRGYAVNQFAGTRALLLAAETRLFVADDVQQLASFALAAFAEGGYAWPEGTRFALRDLRGDVGVSLLIGRNRLSARPARIDLAYAFDPQPGRSRWLVSLGARSGFLD